MCVELSAAACTYIQLLCINEKKTLEISCFQGLELVNGGRMEQREVRVLTKAL